MSEGMLEFGEPLVDQNPEHLAIPAARQTALAVASHPDFKLRGLHGLKDADGRQRVHGIFAAVPYCIDLIGGPYIETDETVVKAFRPKSALRPKI